MVFEAFKYCIVRYNYWRIMNLSISRTTSLSLIHETLQRLQFYVAKSVYASTLWQRIPLITKALREAQFFSQWQDYCGYTERKLRNSLFEVIMNNKNNFPCLPLSLREPRNNCCHMYFCAKWGCKIGQPLLSAHRDVDSAVLRDYSPRIIAHPSIYT